MSEQPLQGDETHQRTVLAIAAYEALRVTGKRSSHRLTLYRCQRGCVLLDVLNLPQGVIYHNPPYKRSPAANEETSSAAGRAKNTVDGDRRWQGWTYFDTECVNVSLNCDHVREVILHKADIENDRAAGHAEMMVNARGERCPA